MINAAVISSFVNKAKANNLVTLDLTSYVRNIAEGTEDYGIMLRTTTEEVSKYSKFYGSRHASTQYRPKLIVTYIEKPTKASSVSVASYWLKKDAAAKVTWNDINSSALKSIQYRVATMTDDGKTVVNSEYAPYDSNPVIGTTASGTASIKTSALGEGCFRVYLRGVDKYGSVGLGKGATFVVDGNAPKLTTASMTPVTSTTAYSNQAQPTIKWSGASDKYLKQVQYCLDSGSYVSMGTTASGSFVIPFGKITTSGKHTIKVRAIDKSGNVSAVKTLYHYFDNKKPTGKITIEDAQGADLGKYKLVFTASDANSGLKSVVLKLSGTSLSSDKVLYSGKAGGQVLFNPASYAEGTYTLTLTVTDNCGNAITVKKSFSSVNLTGWTPKNLTAQDNPI